MPRYFAYGSNMSRARLEARVERVRVVGPAVLEDHRHRFSKLGFDGTGKGNVEDHSRAQVWGVVYELDEAQLRRLAGFEGGYREAQLRVALASGEGLLTHSFRAHDITEGLAPAPDYLGHYLQGMREHALPEHYVEAVLGEWRELL